MVLLCGRGFESLQLHSINSITLAGLCAGVMLFFMLGSKKVGDNGHSQRFFAYFCNVILILNIITYYCYVSRNAKRGEYR